MYLWKLHIPAFDRLHPKIHVYFISICRLVDINISAISSESETRKYRSNDRTAKIFCICVCQHTLINTLINSYCTIILIALCVFAIMYGYNWLRYLLTAILRSHAFYTDQNVFIILYGKLIVLFHKAFNSYEMLKELKS